MPHYLQRSTSREVSHKQLDAGTEIRSGFREKISIDEAHSMGILDIQQIVDSTKDIAELEHPDYGENIQNWDKWRFTYDAGDDFIDEYLVKFSVREDPGDFTARKNISYVPAFAKAAVNDVRDAIFQRISDVTREGGDKSYIEAMEGLGGGVDLANSTMNSFIGKFVLSELLSMSKVGIFIDMPPLKGDTQDEQIGIQPYIYKYNAENIINWGVNPRNKTEFNVLLLKENIFSIDESTGLPEEVTPRYRYMWVRGGFVLVQFFDKDSKPITRDYEPGIDVMVLDLPSIPFVLFEISDSLLTDVANYQIALLNLASSDIIYALKSNYPFYVEQFDPRSDNTFLRPATKTKVLPGESSATIVQGGERDDSIVAKNKEITVGATSGRRVPKGLEMPKFIHPSAEPLKASMMKQDELKKDIQLLVKLAVSNLAPQMASAESKNFDDRRLEAGLSAIGLELERGERLVAKFWQLYMNMEQKPPTVKYPRKYSLESNKDMLNEAKQLTEFSKVVPSLQFKREAMREVVEITVGSKVSRETLDLINIEIDKADVISEPEDLTRDVELGLISLETASKSKGYPDGEVEKAKVDHAERVARIAESQAKARGVADLGGVADASRSEKLDKDEDVTPSKKTKGAK